MPPSPSRTLAPSENGLRVEEEAADEAKSRVAGRSAGIGGGQDGRRGAPRADQPARASAGRRRDGLEPDHAAGGVGGAPQPAAAAAGAGNGSRSDPRCRELYRSAV